MQTIMYSVRQKGYLENHMHLAAGQKRKPLNVNWTFRSTGPKRPVDVERGGIEYVDGP